MSKPVAGGDGGASEGAGGIGVLGALSIGIGGIIGGSFFATVGIAIVGSRGASWISFLLGGVLALLTARSYVTLTLRFPGQGGTVDFVRRAFGDGPVPASVNVLLVLSYVALMAVAALALGSYAASYLPRADRELWARAIAAVAIVSLGAVNLAGSMEKLEILFNLAKLGALALFVIAGLVVGGGEWGRLGPADWVSPPRIVANAMVVFLAYEGFELIANASGEIRNPRTTLPVAYYGSVLASMALYVLVIVIAVVHAPFEALAGARDFALSAVAERFLGPAGFLIMTLGAVLAAASAVNAEFFGAGKLPPMLAARGQLPAFLAADGSGRTRASVVTIGLLAIAAVILVDLHALSAATSGGFLLVYFVVNLACARLAREAGERSGLALVAAIASLVALLVMVAQLLRDPATRQSAYAVAGICVLAVVVYALSRLTRRR